MYDTAVGQIGQISPGNRPQAPSLRQTALVLGKNANEVCVMLASISSQLGVPPEETAAKTPGVSREPGSSLDASLEDINHSINDAMHLARRIGNHVGQT